MLVLKFGGTSVGSAKNIAAVCRIVKKHLRQRPVVVVSAVAKMTDALIELAKSQVTPHPRPHPLPPRTRTSSVQGRQGERELLPLTPALSPPLGSTSMPFGSGAPNVRRAGHQGERESAIVFQKIKHAHQAIVEELGLANDLLEEEFEELENLITCHREPRRSRSGRGDLTILRDYEIASSAFGGLAMTKKTTSGASPKLLDHFQSFGERMSAKIVAAQLEKNGLAAHPFPAWEIGMITDDRFGSAEPLPGAAKVIRRTLTPTLSLRRQGEGSICVPVITGYIGKTRKGEITTLGRGGSDYSAAFIGAAIGAKVIQIWTDVDGVMTTDPRIVPNARIVRELAFEEACELAYFGAKVLHPKTILPAIEKNIPVQVLNSFNPQGKGTTIVRTFVERRSRSRAVEAFACKKGITIVNLRSLGFYDGNKLMARIFDLLRFHGIVIDLVATSVAGVAFAIDTKNNIDIIIRALKRIGTVAVVRGKAIICAVGGSVNAAGVAGKMFVALGRARIPVEMISQAAGGVSMTFVVDEKDAEKAMRVLHREHIR